MKTRPYFLLVLFLFITAFSSTPASAVPYRPYDPFVQKDGEVKKLPPVNWIRSREIDVKHIDIDLKFDWDKEQAAGSSAITFVPFTTTRVITLDAAMMSIEGVSMNGVPLKFTYDGKLANDNLSIDLGRFVSVGETVKVKVDYKTNYVNMAMGDTPIGGFGRGLRFIKPTEDEPNKPHQIWSQGETEFNRYWFPSYDTPNDFRTTTLTATAAKPFYVVSNGKLESLRDNKDGTRTFRWVMDQPYANYLTSIVVAETTPVTQNFDGIPVYNFGYTNETKEVAATVKNLPATMKFFSEVTGVKYPYPKYSQAFVEDFGGGMENISATTQIEEMIHDERELLDNDSESLQSHELAHQWFGDYVTCRDWGQIWLNESFATYMQAMWTEKLKGHDEFLYTDISGNQDQVLRSWNSDVRRPIVTKYYENKDAIFDSYAYPGGGSVLHMLRKHLGDAAFSAALKHYLTANAHQPVSTEEFRIAIEETTGQAMDWFFDEWLYRMGHPIFEITQSYDENAKKLTLTAKQTQKVDPNNEYPQTAYFQSYVDIEIDGKVSRVWMEPKETNVWTFDAATKPKLVNFDYEGTLLKEMTFEKSTDDLIYQMENDKDVLGRKWALEELEKKLSGPDRGRIVNAMITTAEKDAFWRIRDDAFRAVTKPAGNRDGTASGTKPSAEIEALALKLVKDPAPAIRADAIGTLGRDASKQTADIAVSMIADPSYQVVNRAAWALGKSKDPRAFDLLTKLSNTPSWHGRLASAGYTGLAQLADKRSFGPALAAVSNGSLSKNVRNTAVMVVAATGKGDQRAYPLIAQRTKQALERNDIQGAVDGLVAATELADPRGQELFDLAKEKFKNIPGLLPFVAAQEARFKAALKQ